MKIKLLIISLLVLGFFSCNRKTYNVEPDVTYTLPCDTLDIGEIFDPIDTSKVIYGSGVTIGTGDTNRIRFYEGTVLQLGKREPTLDTSDVIVKYVYNWEEGEIETIASKIVYTVSRFGFWSNSLGIPQESKLYKVKDGVWIPIEWPKDIVNVYIRPKK
jgi:hypothetical protein